jgi:hypothetical protein
MNIAFSFLMIASLLTPDRANWCRMIFLGATEESYTCLLIHRTQPGSHYALYDSVYIARFSNHDNSLEDRRLIRAWAWTNPNDQSDQKDTAMAFDISQYLVDHNLLNQFPSDDLDRYSYSLLNGQLYLQSDSSVSLLADSATLFRSLEWLLPQGHRVHNQHLRLQISTLLDNTRVVEYFRLKGFFFFVIRTGHNSGDTNNIQFILPVQEQAVREIVRQFGKE